MDETVTITKKLYLNLIRSQDALKWLENRGLCWRGVDWAFPGWRVGDETEWFYSNNGDVRDKIDEHRNQIIVDSCV